MGFNWINYITRTVWYRASGKRGANVKRRVVSDWASDRSYPSKLAKQRDTMLLKAHLLPRSGFIGSNPELAKKLGVYKKWQAMEANGKWREATILLGREARKRGIDVQVISKSQVAVFNPKIIHIIK